MDVCDVEALLAADDAATRAAQRWLPASPNKRWRERWPTLRVELDDAAER